MVTICTASLPFNNSTFYPHTVFMCFVWISEQTAIIPLYNINWLVFINQSVYCGTSWIFKCGSGCILLSILSIVLSIAVLQLRRLVTSLRESGSIAGQVRVRFVVKKLALGRICFRVLRFSPVSTTPIMLQTGLHLLVAVTRRTNGRSLQTFNQTNHGTEQESTFSCIVLQGTVFSYML